MKEIITGFRIGIGLLLWGTLFGFGAGFGFWLFNL